MIVGFAGIGFLAYRQKQNQNQMAINGRITRNDRMTDQGRPSSGFSFVPAVPYPQCQLAIYDRRSSV
jgi:hypothetical protein